MSVEERKTRSGENHHDIDEYLNGSLHVPEEDDNETYKEYASNESSDANSDETSGYHVHDREELEADEQYQHFSMDLPMDEKVKVYELWEKAHRSELMRFAEASDKRVMIKTLAIARNLLEWGMKPVDVAKNTGMSLDEVERLSKSI